MRPLHFIRRTLQGRKCHAYCIGAAKTGTTSLAQIMSANIRAAHEPEVEKTTQLVIDYLDNNISESEAKSRLLKRDLRLFLEFESSHPLGYLAPLIHQIFPESKFIITYREPLSWLKSRLNYHHYKKPDNWEKYRNFIWSRHFHGYSKEELVLKKNGLFSIDAYLKQYFEQYELILNGLPESNVLFIKTENISQELESISQFLNIKADKLSPVWTNKLQNQEDLINEIPQDFINERLDNFKHIETTCINNIS